MCGTTSACDGGGVVALQPPALVTLGVSTNRPNNADQTSCLNPALLGCCPRWRAFFPKWGVTKASLPTPQRRHLFRPRDRTTRRLPVATSVAPSQAVPDNHGAGWQTVTSRHQAPIAPTTVDVFVRTAALPKACAIVPSQNYRCTGVLVTPVGSYPSIATEHPGHLLVLHVRENPDAYCLRGPMTRPHSNRCNPRRNLPGRFGNPKLDRLAGSDRRSLYRFHREQQHVT